MPRSTFPTALPAPDTALTVLDAGLISAANTASGVSPRGRIIQPLHKALSDPLQRMLNSLQPGTYIRPHRHAEDRAESIVVLSGALLYVVFDGSGTVVERIRLAAGSERMGIDIAGGIYHSFLALIPDTVLFEIKPGPYDPKTDKLFAPWAPEEYSGAVGRYMEQLLNDNS